MKENARKGLRSDGIEVGHIHDRGLSPPNPKLLYVYALNFPSMFFNSVSFFLLLFRLSNL